MREAEDLIRREQLFVHLRICTFVWPMSPIKPPKKKQIHRRHHPMGTVPQLSFVNLCIRIWAKEITALVFCVFYSNPSTIAAVGAIQRRHSPDGGIQWLRVIHRAMRPASYRCIVMAIKIVVDLPAIFVSSSSLLATTISLRPCYGQYKIMRVTNMLISMLSTYSYKLGARRQ